MKNKKSIIILIVLTSLFLGITGIIIYNKTNKPPLNKPKQPLQIPSSYNQYVITNKDAIIYDNNLNEVGKVSSGVKLELLEESKSINNEYFRISFLEQEYYINYNDFDKNENISNNNQRYKNYIVFNKNIVTNNNTTLYDENGNMVFQFNKPFELPIIINDNDNYGVEFNNTLLYVKNESIYEIKDKHNTDKTNSSGVAVLNYHDFYDDKNAIETANCQSDICHSKSQFKEHLDYIKNNNIFTLTMEEIEMYVDGKIQLPKSVLITIDDGNKPHHAVDMLTEYKMMGTIFLVTSMFDETAYYKTEYIELHSHSHNLHVAGVCPGGTYGGGIMCLDETTLLADLKTTREQLNNTTAFCYPFYDYNNYSINVLKKAGFTMAFAGQEGDALVKVGMNKFRLPRLVVTTYTTMDYFINYFEQIKWV